MRTIISAIVVGNSLELYDFSLYGYFATIIAKKFFPANSTHAALLNLFAVYAIGFLIRPLGGIVFSHFGDRFGRKKTLSVSIILMAVGTTLVGLLPTYQEIGEIATVLLVACRLIQGLAISGEISGSMVYVVEHAPANKRAFWGSFTLAGAYIGFLGGSVAASSLTSILSPTIVNNWAWRIPFLMGSILGGFGLYLRLRMLETPLFLEMQTSAQIVQTPIIHLFKKDNSPIFLALSLMFLPPLCFQLTFIYLPQYFHYIDNIPLDKALLINTFNMVILIILLPYFGLLADKIGRKPVLFMGALGSCVFSYPLFLLLKEGGYIAVSLAQISFAILVAMVNAAIPVTLGEMFKTTMRYTGVSLPLNIGNALFGGTAPLIATYLIMKTGNPLAPSYYLMLSGFTMLLVLMRLKESRYNELRG